MACKKPKDGPWPTPSPTTIPEGHCREGFTEFNGYCYKMMGYEDEVGGVDWHRAKDMCKELGLGYELASIHNARETAILITMLADLPAEVQSPESVSKLWIGAHESPAEGIWWWSDETRWDFTNWSPGEPNDINWEVLKNIHLRTLIKFY